LCLRPIACTAKRSVSTGARHALASCPRQRLPGSVPKPLRYLAKIPGVIALSLLRRLVLALAFAVSGLLPVAAMPMLLVDRDTLQVLYAEDAGQPWHPASLTKLMTAYVAFEEIAKGTITLDTPVTVSKAAFNL